MQEGGSRRAVVGGCLGVLLALTGCIGSVSKESFDTEMQTRGGAGIGQRLAEEAVDAVEEDLDVDSVELRSMDLSAGSATIEVRVPGTDDLDRYRYGTSGLHGGGGLDGPDPVQVGPTELPLEAHVFRSADAGLARFDVMVDEALEAAGLRSGYVESATVERPPESSEPVTTIVVTDDRSTVTLTFAPEGLLLGVEVS